MYLVHAINSQYIYDEEYALEVFVTTDNNISLERVLIVRIKKKKNTKILKMLWLVIKRKNANEILAK